MLLKTNSSYCQERRLKWRMEEFHSPVECQVSQWWGCSGKLLEGSGSCNGWSIKHVDSGFEETLLETLWPASLTGGLARGSILLEELRRCKRAVCSHQLPFSLFVLNLNGSPEKSKSAETKWFAVGSIAWGQWLGQRALPPYLVGLPRSSSWVPSPPLCHLCLWNLGRERAHAHGNSCS